ncbi:hypothetical protein [Mariprofundus sp. KV]|uniref:hypothetical protein n=1 Tax=Mariprofundus sp. KV TaxID=2608715 RepID=UPI0015A15C5F|nr:hypothetical protein [Mariprofundus sp. KV]NWF37300.1 hypothetical protein [Mariprofundus sp. KV]
MQQLLHQALVSDPKPCCGLLAGGENMIESALPVTNFVTNDGDKLTHLTGSQTQTRGIYLSSGPDSEPDLQLIAELSSLCQSRLGAAPDYYLLLDLGHQGRMDALLFSDLALTQPQPLNMLEESDLYPQSSNR